MKKYIDRKILETLITKYGKSNINLAVNRLNEARAKAPSKWTKIKKNSRNVENSYRVGDIYDRHSGSYKQNDTYTDITYEGYIIDKNGNEYRVNGKSIHGDSGSIAGGGRDYYVNIFLDDNVIKLKSYSGIMTNSTGSAIINSIGDGYYLEDYLAIYKNDIDYESRKIAAPLIQNGTIDVKSNETNKEERKQQLLLSKKEKFFKTYEKLNSISADIDEYGEWSNIKINNNSIEKIDSIENLLDKKFNNLFNASKYNYAGIKFILEFGSNSAFNKYTYDIISYDNKTYKIDTDKIGYTFIWTYISADKINKDLKRALINKWKESSRWSMHKNNQYKELINLVKTSSKPIHFNDKENSYYNDAYPIGNLIVNFERKLPKNKKITKDDSVHNEPVSADASLNNYPKIAYDKMLAWHEGTRKQNVGAMGDEKLKMNYNICKAMGYNKEANILKVEADERGLLLENTQFNTIIDNVNETENEFIYQATLCTDWFGSCNHCKLVNDRSTMDRWMGKKINDILKTGEVIDDGFSKTAAGPRPDRYEVYDIPKDGQYIKYGAYIIKYSKGNDIGNYYYIPNRVYDILEREFNRSSKINDVNEMAYNYNILSDCPLTYNNQLDFKEYFIKRSKQEGYKFNKDMFYFDDIDCVDGKTSRDIPGVKANKTLNFDEAYNRLLKYFLNNLQEQVKMKRNNDRMLLESLVRKYGKNNIVKSINEMEEHLEPITIYIDYVVDDSMQLRKDIICFRKNDIKAECEIEEQFDNMELTAISEKSKYALTDWLLNYYLDDADLIEEYWPELLPYVDDCEGKFINYNNCF